jgi:hypothetical protein
MSRLGFRQSNKAGTTGAGIEQSVQPLRRRQGEAQGDGTAARRVERPQLGFAQDRRAERIGDDEAAFRRDQLVRETRGDGEIEPVALLPVFRPFAIGAEIGDRGFDLDDRDLAAAAERDDVGAPAAGKVEFMQAGKAELAQRPADAPREQGGTAGRAFRYRIGGIIGNRHDDVFLTIPDKRRTAP